MTLDPNATTAAKLDALDRQISAVVRSSKWRDTMTTVFGAASVLGIGYWLYYAHHRFANEVTPQLAASIGQTVMLDYLPSASSQLQDSMQANAPHVVDEGEKQLRSAPEHLEDAFRTHARATMDEEMPGIEDRLYASMKTGLAHAQQESDQGNAGKSDEDRFRGMLGALAVIYGTQTTGFVDQLHADYVKNSGNIINGLDLLAEGKNLSPQQQTQRNLIRDLLILAKESAPASETTPAQKPSNR